MLKASYAPRSTLHAPRFIFKRAACSVQRAAGYLFLFILCGLIPYSYAQDKIIAVVNNEIITQSDLSNFLNFMRMHLSSELKGQDLENKVQSMKLDLLDRLIEDKLILQEAKKNNLAIDESKINLRIDEIKKQYGSDAGFQKTLAKQGLTQSDLEARIREQLLIYGVIDARIRNKIIITPKEITDFYNNHTEQLKIPERREVISIMVGQDLRLANSISYDLKEGGDLDNIIAKYSLKASRITVRKNSELKKDIGDEVFRLEPGELSRPISINNAFYIFKLENIIAPQQQSLSEAQEVIHAHLFEEKMQKELARWMEEIKQKAYIKILHND